MGRRSAQGYKGSLIAIIAAAQRQLRFIPKGYFLSLPHVAAFTLRLLAASAAALFFAGASGKETAPDAAALWGGGQYKGIKGFVSLPGIMAKNKKGHGSRQ